MELLRVTNSKKYRCNVRMFDIQLDLTVKMDGGEIANLFTIPKDADYDIVLHNRPSKNRVEVSVIDGWWTVDSIAIKMGSSLGLIFTATERTDFYLEVQY